jgi:uncharacterized protein (DUF1778 family)
MSVAESAKKVFDEDLRFRLEQDHKDDFVAILGKTFLEGSRSRSPLLPEITTSTRGA